MKFPRKNNTYSNKNLAADNPGLPDPIQSKFHRPSINGDLDSLKHQWTSYRYAKQKLSCFIRLSTYVVGRGVGLRRSRPVILSFTSIRCISVVFPVTKASNPPASLNWNRDSTKTIHKDSRSKVCRNNTGYSDNT